MRVRFPRKRRAGPRLRRGIYLIPSLFTIANIACGFWSIVSSSHGQFQRAALLILVAGVADILDGRIARMTGTTSAFGAAYDSLADVISFGVAPALLAFHWGLWQLPDAGPWVAFLYLVAGSIRLARFNTSAVDSRHFMGLPIPGGASGIAMLVLVSPKPVQHPAFIPVVLGFVLALSLLMVSNLPYRSFKDLNLRRQWPAPTLFVLAIAVSLITWDPRVVSILVGLYILSAPLTVLMQRARGRKPAEASAQPSQPSPGASAGHDSSEADAAAR